ncbi:MAG: MFS transporter [Ignavibacteriales bacterium]|nr:MFS transporter [Ignavibacteriales bacterium]
MIKSDHHINKNLAALLFTVFLDFLGFGIVIPVIAPVLLDPVNGILDSAYSMNERTIILGLLISAFPAAQFFGAPILGAYSDKYGRKKVLLISIFTTSVSLLLFGIGISSRSIFLLFVSRILNGFMGGNVSTAQSAIADMSELQSKAKNFGMMGMMFGLGFILGPFVGGKLSDFHSHSWLTFSTPFWVAGTLSMVNVFLIASWFDETLKNPKTDVQIKFSTGLRNLKRAFDTPNLRAIFIVSFLVIFGFTSFTQFFQVYLISKFNFNQAHLGMTFGYLGLWIAITQGGVVRILAKKYSPVSILRVSIAILGAAVFLLLVPQNEIWLYFILPFVAMAQGASTPNITTMISNSARESDQGEILGINQSVQSVGFAIPPIVAGFIAIIDIRFPIVVGSIFIFASWIYFIIYFKKVRV